MSKIFAVTFLSLLTTFWSAACGWAAASEQDGVMFRIEKDAMMHNEEYTAEVSISGEVRITTNGSLTPTIFHVDEYGRAQLSELPKWLKDLRNEYSPSAVECDVMITHEPIYRLTWSEDTGQRAVLWDQMCHGFVHEYRLSRIIEEIEDILEVDRHLMSVPQ